MIWWFGFDGKNSGGPPTFPAIVGLVVVNGGEKWKGDGMESDVKVTLLCYGVSERREGGESQVRVNE